MDKGKPSEELISANRELATLIKEKKKLTEALTLANKEVAFQNEEKGKRSEELTVANRELAFQNKEKGKRAEELTIANRELAFQDDEKEKRSEELAVANIELLFQGHEKEKRAAEQILTEDELKKSENQFQLMVSTIKNYSFIMLDTQGRIATWNTGAEHINGYSKEEIIGKPHDVFYTQNEIESGEPQRKLQMALLHGHFESEGFRVRKDGSLFYANTVLTTIFDKTGELSGYSKITKDISERRKAEHDLKELNRELEQRVLERTEKLARSEAFNVDVLNSLTSHIAVLDKNGTIVAVNDSWNRFAKENGDVTFQRTGVGSNYLDVCKKAATEGIEEANLVIKGIQHVMAEKMVHFSLEYACHSPSKHRWFSMRVVKFKNDEPMVVISHQNITSRKEAEQKLLKSNRLYAFISAINQSIVHINDEQELLEKACDISVTIGGYKTSWIGLLDEKGKLNVASIKGDEAMMKEVRNYSGSDYSSPQMSRSTTEEVMRTGKYVMKNVVQKDPTMKPYKKIFVEHGIKATISFPITKFSKTVGVFCFYSTTEAFFDEEEIALLEEGANDISFAMENFEKAARHKKAEDKTIESEARYRSFFENSMDAILLTSSDGNVMAANPAACAIFRMSENEIRHTGRHGLIDTSDKRASVLINELQRTGKAKGELTFIQKDGTTFPGELSSALFHDSIGNERTSMIIRDITIRKQAEDKILATSVDLRLALNEIHAIMDSSLDVICAVDPDGRIIKVSAACEAVWGYKPEELTGKKIFDLIYHEDLLKTVESAEEVMQGKNQNHFENQYVHKNGSLVPMSWTATWDDKARIRYGVGRDVTDQKMAEKMKDKITADIVQRNNDLEQFSFIVSHNLRAPVANIIGLTGLLQAPNIEADESTHMLGDLAASVSKLDMVIKDLNYILQIKREVTEKKMLVHFSELVSDIKISIGQMIKKEQVVIQTDFSEAHTFFTLKSYLYSIFYNLITNSIKYRQPGIAAHLEITSTVSETKIILKFKDNGLGIDLKKRGDQVFGLYKRFHTHTDGKGMGLFMVKTQVETLGGKITIQSELNKGTEFKIEFEKEETTQSLKLTDA